MQGSVNRFSAPRDRDWLIIRSTVGKGGGQCGFSFEYVLKTVSHRWEKQLAVNLLSASTLHGVLWFPCSLGCCNILTKNHLEKWWNSVLDQSAPILWDSAECQGDDYQTELHVLIPNTQIQRLGPWPVYLPPSVSFRSEELHGWVSNNM